MSWKSVEFKGVDSVERVQRLQALCSSAYGQTDRSVDAILIVGGIDSFHSQTCQAVIKYLFLGGSGQELLGEQVIAQERERLEDVVLLLRRHSVSIFYSSESDAAVAILPAISKWRNVSEFVIHDGMDPDEQEARKIAAFKRMVANIPRIGVPFGVDEHGENLEDVMIPEKWPLVQSYGLEEGESRARGFFTMNHSVVNVSAELTAAMAQLDGFTTRRVVAESEPLLSHHFDEFLRKLDHADSPETRSQWSESEMVDDLLSFYEFGTTQFSSRGLVAAPTRGAKVLYGSRSDSTELKSSPSAFVATSGPTPKRPATHMIVQAEDPFSGVRVTRTYFLSTGRVCKRIVDSEALVQQEAQAPSSSTDDSASSATDTRMLIALYAALLQGFKTSMVSLSKQFAQSPGSKTIKELIQSTKEAAAIAMRKNLARIDDLAVQPRLVELSRSIEAQLCVTIEFLDACGRTTVLPSDITGDWHLMYYSLKLASIPGSNIVDREMLGALVVGDSLLIRSHTLSEHDPSTGGALCVTKSFPYFRSWAQAGDESASKEAINVALKSDFMLQAPGVQLGQAVFPLGMDPSSELATQGSRLIRAAPTSRSDSSELSSAMVLLDIEEMPVVRGTMRVFTSGFLFKCPHFNPLLVSFARHVESFHLVPSDHEELVLLTLYLKSDEHSQSTPLSEMLPLPFEMSCVRIPMLSGSRFQAEILHSLSTWKETAAKLDIPFYRPHDLTAQQPEGETPRGTDSKKYELPQVVKDACTRLVTKQRLVGEDAVALDHLFPSDFIPKDAGMIVTLAKPSTTRLCIPVTVMIGVPGSNVGGMACSVCDIASASFDWSQVCVDLRSSGTNQIAHFEARAYGEVLSALTCALNRIVEHRESLTLPPRIMLAITGYIDPITVACAVRRAATSSSITVKLSAIVTCVSATSVYVPDEKQASVPFPKLFDQMAAGFATHILLTNSAEISSAKLQRLRYRMDQCNPFADVQVLSYHVFESPVAPLLAVERFDSVYYKRYREIHYPEWDDNSDKQHPSWTKYVSELDAHECPESYRFRLVPGVERPNFIDLVVRTLTPFATHGKTLESVHPLGSEMKTPTGIRLAQFIAAGKLQFGAGPTDPSVAKNELFKSAITPSAWCVEGRVSFEDDSATVFEYLCSGSHARLRESPMSSETAPSLELSITGVGINATKLRQLLLNCYALTSPVKQQMRTKLSVTMEEKRELQKEHAMDPLPDGFMYDGVNYVDFYGGRYEFHPDMPKFIDQHIAESNDAANAANIKSERAQTTERDFVTLIE